MNRRRSIAEATGMPMGMGIHPPDNLQITIYLLPP